MALTLIVVLVLAFILAAIIIVKNKSDLRIENDPHNGSESSKKKLSENTKRIFDGTDEEVIDEILLSKDISRALIEQTPWRNRKYKNHSDQKLKEMHAKFMEDAHIARLARNDDKASSIMSKVADINAESAIRRQIKIHRVGRKPININDPNDESRLKYLLTKKQEDYEYKVLTDEMEMNYESVVHERFNDLKRKYKEQGYDENNSNLLAKCKLFGIKLES